VIQNSEFLNVSETETESNCRIIRLDSAQTNRIESNRMKAFFDVAESNRIRIMIFLIIRDFYMSFIRTEANRIESNTNSSESNRIEIFLFISVSGMYTKSIQVSLNRCYFKNQFNISKCRSKGKKVSQ
jgi:hypothetical protein